MNFRTLGPILLLGAMWGTSFLLIKIAVMDIPPLSLAALRLGIGGLILWLVVLVQRSPFVITGKGWLHMLVMSITACAFPFALISMAEQYIDSAVAGILNGLTPLFTILLAHFFISCEKMSLRRIVGVLSGFVGTLILLSPALMGEEIMTDLWSMLGVALAALSYAVGMVYGRYFLKGQYSLSFTAMQLSTGPVVLFPFIWLFELPWPISDVSWQSWGAIFTLALWGTSFAYVLYYKILHDNGALALSMVTYLLPLFSVILGLFILDEQLSLYAYAAGILILLGMLLVNQDVHLHRSRKNSHVAKTRISV